MKRIGYLLMHIFSSQVSEGMCNGDFLDPRLLEEPSEEQRVANEGNGIFSRRLSLADFLAADTNNDGIISQEEFLSWISRDSNVGANLQNATNTTNVSSEANQPGQLEVIVGDNGTNVTNDTDLMCVDVSTAVTQHGRQLSELGVGTAITAVAATNMSNDSNNSIQSAGVTVHMQLNLTNISNTSCVLISIPATKLTNLVGGIRPVVTHTSTTTLTSTVTTTTTITLTTATTTHTKIPTEITTSTASAASRQGMVPTTSFAGGSLNTAVSTTRGGFDDDQTGNHINDRIVLDTSTTVAPIKKETALPEDKQGGLEVGIIMTVFMLALVAFFLRKKLCVIASDYIEYMRAKRQSSGAEEPKQQSSSTEDASAQSIQGPVQEDDIEENQIQPVAPSEQKIKIQPVAPKARCPICGWRNGAVIARQCVGCKAVGSSMLDTEALKRSETWKRCLEYSDILSQEVESFHDMAPADDLKVEEGEGKMNEVKIDGTPSTHGVSTGSEAIRHANGPHQQSVMSRHSAGTDIARHSTRSESGDYPKVSQRSQSQPDSRGSQSQPETGRMSHVEGVADDQVQISIIDFEEAMRPGLRRQVTTEWRQLDQQAKVSIGTL
eukprot:gnl/MRDRNA2_/MRDRNA2_99620_c0_seq1.p1 gnl/MRDRNA2_/MRDRNA2_99620_c0~~gnl/MRDRNA2_/MRDRNA2_99620_c0_seq1.p1  ORF type:complete len:608 (-),score=87.04 gnl/MRDRNA2_/MRDRNA2_99620_c0_seq1:115-1938(-)